jgi:hypothetical protein
MDERIKQAQDKLDWLIKKLDLTIKCKVMNYGDNLEYSVRFLTQDDKLIEKRPINEDLIDDTHPENNYWPDELRSKLIDIDRRAKRVKKEEGGEPD